LLTNHESELDKIEKESMRLLKDWLNNPVSSPEASAPAIYAKWYMNLMEDVFKAQMGEELFMKFVSKRYIACKALDNLMKKGQSGWFNDGLDQVLFNSFRRSIRELTELLKPDPKKWQWRDLQKVSFDHVLGKRALT
jgi:penicillin G amidase